MSDGTGLAEALLGLEGFRVLAVIEGPDEVVVTIETTDTLVGCGSCGVRVESQDRVRVSIRDLACFGRPARLVWNKRRWRCTEAHCEAKTGTETSAQVSSRRCLPAGPAWRLAARWAPTPVPWPDWLESSVCAGGR